MEAVETAGGCHIAFNAIPARALVKVLTQVSSDRGITVPKSLLEGVAAEAGGDIRHALA